LWVGFGFPGFWGGGVGVVFGDGRSTHVRTWFWSPLFGVRPIDHMHPKFISSPLRTCEGSDKRAGVVGPDRWK
jgi:hypothetical protein